MNDTISIIIPIYNVEKQLNRCLNSVIKQTYENLEIILIDDGSSDNSYKICCDYVEKDKRIKIIKQKNFGVSVARNKGIDIASGKYIMFVDADDYLNIRICEKLIKEIKKIDADIMICNKNFYIKGRLIENTLYKKDLLIREEEKDLFLLDLFTNKFDKEMHNVQYLSCGVTAKLFKTDIINNNKIRFVKNCHFGEDVIFNMYAFQHSKRIAYINFDGYNFVVSRNSSSHKYKEFWEDSHNKFADEIDNFIEKYNKDERFLEVREMMRATRITSLLTLYYFHKDNPKDFEERYKALKSLIKQDKYKNAIKKVKFRLLTNKQKIIMLFLKLNCIYLLAKLCELITKKGE